VLANCSGWEEGRTVRTGSRTESSPDGGRCASIMAWVSSLVWAKLGRNAASSCETTLYCIVMLLRQHCKNSARYLESGVVSTFEASASASRSHAMRSSSSTASRAAMSSGAATAPRLSKQIGLCLVQPRAKQSPSLQ
jgi:hypothetical protein